MSELHTASRPEIESRIAPIRDWLRERCGVEGEVELDTDLIGCEIVTSLKLIELVLLVEELRGGEIPEMKRDADRLRTLRSIATHYLTG